MATLVRTILDGGLGLGLNRRLHGLRGNYWSIGTDGGCFGCRRSSVRRGWRRRFSSSGGFWGRGFWLGTGTCGRWRDSRWCDSSWRDSPRRNRSRHGNLLGTFRLGRNRRQSLGQDVDGTRCPRLVGLSLPLINLGYHEYFFQLAEIGRGTHLNIEKELAARRHLRHSAHQQALGENPAPATGENQFSSGHSFVAHHFFQHHFARRRPAQYALQPRFV